MRLHFLAFICRRGTVTGYDPQVLRLQLLPTIPPAPPVISIHAVWVSCTQAGLKLSIEPNLALNSWSACLYLPRAKSTEIKCECGLGIAFVLNGQTVGWKDALSGLELGEREWSDPERGGQFLCDGLVLWLGSMWGLQNPLSQKKK